MDRRVITAAVAGVTFVMLGSTARANSPVCDAKAHPRDYAECVRKAQDESDRLLRDRVQAVMTRIDAAAAVQAPQKARWKKAVDDGQALWLRFRNAECQELTPFEAANKSRIAEEQRLCLIGYNTRRMEELDRRYPAVTANN